MVSTSEMLEEVLLDIKKIEGVESLAISTRDGLLIASDTLSDLRDETFVAMSAIMLGAAEHASKEIGKDSPDRVIVESNSAKLIAKGSGNKAILITLASPDSQLGLILDGLEKGASRIKEILC